MAQTLKETITVASLGKWGPKVGNEYYSWSKNIKDSDKGRIVPGGTFECDIYVADSGKKYINSVAVTLPAVNQSRVTATPLVVPEVVTFRTKVSTPVSTVLGKPIKTEIMSKEEWNAKDRRISRQGCIQVAVQVESDFDKAVALADRMLEFVNR